MLQILLLINFYCGINLHPWQKGNNESESSLRRKLLMQEEQSKIEVSEKVSRMKMTKEWIRRIRDTHTQKRITWKRRRRRWEVDETRTIGTRKYSAKIMWKTALSYQTRITYTFTHALVFVWLRINECWKRTHRTKWDGKRARAQRLRWMEER